MKRLALGFLIACSGKPLPISPGPDPRVKQAESEQIVAAMKQHELPVTYVVFPDEGHGFARSELEASSIQIKDGKAGIPGLDEDSK